MCINLNINALEVKIDARVVADLMNYAGSSNAVNSSLVADCRNLLSQVPQVKVMHCHREANRRADALARLGTSLSSNFVYFSSPPPNLLDVFLSDMYGHYHFRLCPATDVTVSFS